MDKVKAVIDQAAGWLKWGTGIVFAVAVPLYLLEIIGIRVVNLPSAQLLIYVAGIWWLTR